MNAVSLNSKIEELAEKKARAHVDRMWHACRDVGAKTGHATKPGDGTWYGKTIIAVLEVYLRGLKEPNNNGPNLPRSEELVNYYRACILEEILTKIPLIEELAMMRADCPESE